MKNLLLIAVILFSGMLAKAQGVFFPTKEGTVLEYKTYNQRNEEIGMVRYTITNVKTSGENMDITYMIESMDPKDKTVFNEELTVHKKGDKLYLDMSKFVNKAAFQKGGELPAEVKITGNEMEIPSNLEPGGALANAEVDMAMKIGYMNLKMSALVTDRMVESFGNITVKAGSFNAYKISSKVTANVLGMKSTSSVNEWYVKGVGMVKSETYDKHGNLEAYTELVELHE